MSYLPNERSPNGWCFVTNLTGYVEPDIRSTIRPGETLQDPHNEETAQAITACIQQIPDGPCDAFCSSCKYCLPVAVPGYPSCYDHDDGLQELFDGGHNSNNDAQMTKILWQTCIDTNGAFPDPTEASMVETCRDVCGGPGAFNIATCSAVDEDTENADFHADDGECDGEGIYGPSNALDECGYEGQQPICRESALPVCGIG